MQPSEKNLERVIAVCSERLQARTPGAIAKALQGAGYSFGVNTVKGWFRKKVRNVSAAGLIAVAKITRARLEWLQTGEGERYEAGLEPPRSPAPPASASAPNGGRLHAMHDELTRLYLTMEEPERIRLVAEFFGWAADRATGRGREGPPGQAPAKRKTSK